MKNLLKNPFLYIIPVSVIAGIILNITAMVFASLTIGVFMALFVQADINEESNRK